MFKFRFLSFILAVIAVYFSVGAIAKKYFDYYQHKQEIETGTVGMLVAHIPPVMNVLVIVIGSSLIIFVASYLLFTYIQNRFFP